MDIDEFTVLAAGRRSIRSFLPRPVDPVLVEKLLTTAHWGPSAHNRQPWRFVVVRDARTRVDLADRMAERLAADLRAEGVPQAVIEQDTVRSRLRLGEAPLLIVVTLTMAEMDHYPDHRRQSLEHQMAVQSVAMAAQNLMLAAHAAGLGSCWLCAPLFCADVVRGALNLPADLEPQGVIILGYSAETRTKTREPLHTRVIER